MVFLDILYQLSGKRGSNPRALARFSKNARLFLASAQYLSAKQKLTLALNAFHSFLVSIFFFPCIIWCKSIPVSSSFLAPRITALAN